MLNSQNNKIWIIYAVFIVLVLCIIARMFYLQVIRYDFFKENSIQQQKRKITIYPNRGDILDRNGMLLASSSKAFSVYLDPRYKHNNKEQVFKEMTQVLGISQEKAEQLFNIKSYILVKPKVEKHIAHSLKAKGLDLIPDTIRVYPGKRLASQVLGYVGVDNQGRDGLEKRYNSILGGKSGYMIMESDLRGREIFSDRKKVFPVNDGCNIETTIDKYVQFILEEALEKGAKKVEAKSASGVVMDVYTGEIYAMASYPGFDPNDYSEDYRKNPKSFWNRPIFMDYEPGSVMKLFTIAAALEEGVIKKTDKIYCPHRFIVDKTVIEEAHDAEEDDILTKDIAEIIVKSLNVGAAKVGLELGGEKMHSYFSKLGFGKRTGIELTGESPGTLRHFSSWYKIDLSRMAFGYGLTATPLQIARAAATFANGGDLVQPHIIKDTKIKKEKIFSKDTSAFVLDAMRRTVEEGTGTYAKIPSFNIGGKTGTSRLFSPDYNRYLIGQYNTTFVGVFPTSKPKFVVLVMVNDPARMKYASTSSVPIFKEVVERMIRYLNIDPA